jgi:hypothetical protein
VCIRHIRLPCSLVFAEVDTWWVVWTRLFYAFEVGADMIETRVVKCDRGGCCYLMTIVELKVLLPTKISVQISLITLRRHVAWGLGTRG